MAESIDFFPIQVEQADWKTTSAILTEIRSRVFIDEQHVPAEEEYDGLDETAVHWIAWGENNTPMGVARLVGKQVGRMAVLKPYRQKGVGSSLIRAIIAYAIERKFDWLVLDAQVHAVGFYRDNGFDMTGGEFEDAGIPHVPMAMNLNRFIHRRPEPTVPEIDEALRERRQLDTKDDFRQAAFDLASHSDRYIRILSDQLDPQIYDNDELCRAVYNLVVNHPQSRVMILVKDTDTPSKHFHRLVETFYKLSSHIELRRLTREVETPHQEFMTGNIASVLYNQNPRRYTGYLCLHAPLEAKQLNEDFDTLWNYSKPDPQIRQLHI